MDHDHTAQGHGPESLPEIPRSPVDARNEYDRGLWPGHADPRGHEQPRFRRCVEAGEHLATERHSAAECTDPEALDARTAVTTDGGKVRPTRAEQIATARSTPAIR
jgi:hypothetical protein